jgi:exo-beta-1,3-glucanase (GH17 family)/cellulose synthase/poly-beta-1,6-N-acetylglucosamine synthase-like glycosyltransferase
MRCSHAALWEKATMTTHALASDALRIKKGRKSFFNPATLLALGLAAAASFGLWDVTNPKVQMPAYTGDVGGLAFTPFHRGETPEANIYPSDAEIRGDLAKVSAITGHIRTYSLSGSLADIPRLAAAYPLQITLGAWIDKNQQADQQEVKRLIETANANPNVERVLVGNEVTFRGDIPVQTLIGYIKEAKASVHVPVSTAEQWWVWLKHPELAASVDYITIHLLPYWEGLPIDDALRYSMDRLDQVQRAYPGKHIVIGEVGWPSNGVAIGGAQASLVNQALFLRKFFNIAREKHLDYYVMEAFDQPFKTSFEGRAAGYWGMFDLDRNAKWSLSGPVQEHPNWAIWAAFSIAGAFAAAGLLLSRRPDIRFTGKLLVAGLAQTFGAVFALVLLSMAGKYLSHFAEFVWGTLAAGQALLIFLLLADSFELAETVFGRIKRRHPDIRPAPMGALLPKVSLHLPICNEPPHMVCATLDALARLDYPDYEVLVIDNNTTDPALWEPVAQHCARLGAKFRFFHLGKWKGFKAGALNFALRHTAPGAEVIGVLDSDYIVESDWLRCMVPQFGNPRVGFVQSPQDYHDNDGSFFKRLMFWEYAGFFQLGMVNRNERNAIIQHGTMSLIRRSALEQSGDWAEWTITEDAELGLRLFREGWEAVYSPRSFGKGVMPDDFAAFRKQRFRWAYGAMQIVRGHAGALLNPFNRELTLGQRWHFVTGWLPWVGDALGLAFLVMGLLWSIGLIVAPMRFEFPIVLFMIPSIGLFFFKLAQIFALYGAKVPCGWQDRLGAAIAGLALSHTIGKAVWKGLFIRSAPFLRTPKMEDAPALVQGIVMAREELVLLVLAWAAMIAVGWVHHLATWEATLWCIVLLTQSLPYLAAVTVSVVAAFPAREALPAAATAPKLANLMPSYAFPAVSLQSENGD